MSNQFNLAYATDLNEGLKVIPIQPVFISGDDKAHSFVISTNRSGKEEKLTGATVRGYFIRPDNVTVTIEGSVNDEGQAVVVPSASCYNKQGRFQIVIRAIIDGVASTVFCGDGRILLSATDSFIDEEDIVPSLDELLAQIERIESAVNNANTAADRANTAAARAENAKGDTGATPNLTIGTVETLDAGSNATASITGTAEDPVLHLGIPKGFDGVGAVLSVNGKTGQVTLAASDVGASPSDHTHTAVAVGAAPATEDATYKGCYYRTVDGVKEWIIPPDVLNTEYRIAKRFNGRPVYRQWWSVGTLVNNTTKTVSTGTVGRILTMELVAFRGTTLAHIIAPAYDNGTLILFANAANGNINITCKTDLTAYKDCFVLLEYTKTYDI